ncbi:hypothetical protein L596_010337 [Steinernema carpocapsae]|uniref:Uncharacterized protein n=1 Tax=Steinernema carpocapsae TaxID=34508 RepID=A0A4V6A6V3_STECR|nr:hypothetical protein L596_010337 [Steinernema carpocapsae]
MQNDDISWILRYLDTEQGGPKKPRPGGRRHVWKSRRASGKLIRNRTVCANRSDQLFTTMPRFSRDELVEIRTLMNVGYEADEIQDQRGSRNAGNPATEAELKRRIRIAWKNYRTASSHDGSPNFFLASALLSHMKADKFNNTSIAYDFVIDFSDQFSDRQVVWSRFFLDRPVDTETDRSTAQHQAQMKPMKRRLVLPGSSESPPLID